MERASSRVAGDTPSSSTQQCGDADAADTATESVTTAPTQSTTVPSSAPSTENRRSDPRRSLPASGCSHSGTRKSGTSSAARQPSSGGQPTGTGVSSAAVPGSRRTTQGGRRENGEDIDSSEDCALREAGVGFVIHFGGVMVQTRRALDSPAVLELPVGAQVVAAEVRGRRARITHPVDGWLSCRSAVNGMCIVAAAPPGVEYTGPPRAETQQQVSQLAASGSLLVAHAPASPSLSGSRSPTARPGSAALAGSAVLHTSSQPSLRLLVPGSGTLQASMSSRVSYLALNTNPAEQGGSSMRSLSAQQMMHPSPQLQLRDVGGDDAGYSQDGQEDEDDMRRCSAVPSRTSQGSYLLETPRAGVLVGGEPVPNTPSNEANSPRRASDLSGTSTASRNTAGSTRSDRQRKMRRVRRESTSGLTDRRRSLRPQKVRDKQHEAGGTSPSARPRGAASHLLSPQPAPAPSASPGSGSVQGRSPPAGDMPAPRSALRSSSCRERSAVRFIAGADSDWRPGLLPPRALVALLGFVPPRDAVRLCAVCRAWRAALVGPDAAAAVGGWHAHVHAELAARGIPVAQGGGRVAKGKPFARLCALFNQATPWGAPDGDW